MHVGSWYPRPRGGIYEFKSLNWQINHPESMVYILLEGRGGWVLALALKKA